MPLGINGERLPAPSIVKGSIGGKICTLDVFSEEQVALNGVVLVKEQGAIIFDRQKKGRLSSVDQVVAYVPNDEAVRIEVKRTVEAMSSQLLTGNIYEASRFGETLAKLAIKAEEQTGLRSKGKRSLIERFFGL